MPNLAPVKSHLTTRELRNSFRQCKDANEKTHWQAILLRHQGRTTAEVAEICGYNVDWVRRLVRLYNKHGPESLRDGRRNNGKRRMMSNVQLEELRRAILESEPPGGGLWTGPKVAQWMTQKLGRRVSPQRAWDYLQYLGMSKQTPRPRNWRANKQEQDDFKKKLRRRVGLIGRHHPHASVEIWAQDEARVGLVPIVRRVWAPRGERPLALQHRRYEWLYIYAFVQPSTGAVEWLLLPTVNVELFELALQYFAKASGAGVHHRVLLLIDRAGWHLSKKLKVPEGIHLLPLPAYSPELQPVERLWPLIRESEANEYIPNMDTLESLLVDRCQELRAQPDVIIGHTLFDWWAHAAQSERVVK